MKKKFVIAFLIFIVLSSLLSAAFFFCGKETTANFILNVLTAIGTCGTVLYALYESTPKKEEIKAYYRFIPTDNCYPVGSNMETDKVANAFEIELINVGVTNIILPDVLHIDIYANKYHWGKYDIPIENSKLMIPNMPRNFRCRVNKKDPMRFMSQEPKIEVYTWTANGTILKAERRKMYYTEPQPILLK